jgi:predicted DNA-binding ribbon-helix-helix protein
MTLNRSDSLGPDLSVLRFRIITVAGQRRGIKLEEIYWSSLVELAAHKQCKLAEIVAECGQANGGDGNLTAKLRYVATAFLRSRLSSAQERTGLSIIAGQVRACPSPAFALTGDKRIISYNPAFLTFVQTRFARFQQTSPAQGLRLSFDIQFADLVARLKGSPGEPQPAGFTIGVNEQLTRGRLNAALASFAEQDVVIGFILG